MAPLAKALYILQSDKMAYTGMLVPTISILIDRIDQYIMQTYPLVDAIINGLKQRIG